MAGQRRIAKKSPQKGPGAAGSMGHSPHRAVAGESQEVCAAVIAAVQSLYDDGLKPLGRILRKRLGEKSQAGSEGVDLSIERLHAVCQACGDLVIESAEGGDWTALLVSRPPCFVDVCSPVDVYPESMWQEAASYFESLEGDNGVLPGGRYSCAEELSNRGVPFLKPYSLGQICHIVQLSISQKKLLGYCSGAVVPYSRSQSMVKDQCAVLQQPCTSPSNGSAMAMADWTTARRCLQEILDNSTCPAAGVVPLSNVKRLFRSMYHIELSETILGHSKVSELLQDPRFADICTVQLQGHGYIVVKNGPVSPSTPAPSSPKRGGQHNRNMDWSSQGGYSPQRTPSPNRQIRSPVPPGLQPPNLEDAVLMMNLSPPAGMQPPMGMGCCSPAASPFAHQDGTVVRSPERSPSPGKRRSAAYAAASLAAAHGMIQAAGCLEPPGLPTQGYQGGLTPADYQSPARSQSPQKSRASFFHDDEAAPVVDYYGGDETIRSKEGSICSSNTGSTTASLEGANEVSPSLRSSLHLTPSDEPMKIWLPKTMQGSPDLGAALEHQEARLAMDEVRRAAADLYLPPGLPMSTQTSTQLAALLSPTRVKKHNFAVSSLDTLPHETAAPSAFGEVDGQTMMYAPAPGPRGPLSPQRTRPAGKTGNQSNLDMRRPGNVEVNNPWTSDIALLTGTAGPLSPVHQPRASSGRGGEFSWSPSRRGPGRIPTHTDIELLAQSLTEEELHAALMNPAAYSNCTLRLSELV